VWRRDRASARDAAGWLPALLVEMPPRKESLELPPRRLRALASAARPRRGPEHAGACPRRLGDDDQVALGVDRLVAADAESLINARRKSVLPAVRERQGLAVELARIMGQLGLKRRAVDGGDASRALLEVKRDGRAEVTTALQIVQ